MGKKVTINDIARIAEVSRTTVSNYLNQKYAGMSDKTREKIGQVIKELHYRPSHQARALRMESSALIGISVVDISNSYTSRLLKGIMERLKTTSYHTIIMNSDFSKAAEQKNLVRLLDEQIEGLLIQPLGESSEDYQGLELTVPLVQIDRYVEPLLWPAVVSDNYAQSKRMAELILQKGYERVLVVTPSLVNHSPRISRYLGLMAALQDSKVEVEVVITKESRDIVATDEEIWQEISPHLQGQKKIAIYAFNGALLYGITQFLKREQIKIPSQVGLVGYDDGSLTNLISPALTSIEQNPITIGYKAADKLLESIAGRQDKPIISYVDSQLNIQESL